MRIATQRRIQLLLLSTSVLSTMFVMQRLWSLNDCDPLCKVMKEENQYFFQRSSNTNSSSSSSSSSSSCSSDNSANASGSVHCQTTGTRQDTTTTTMMTTTTTMMVKALWTTTTPPSKAHQTTALVSIPPNGSVPFCPFEKGEPKLIVILTYQRCGSTFFGNLFNQNPEAFYMFEPLDSLYSSLYGTKQGWNVPSDIVNYRNGTRRELPAIELQKVYEFLQTLFTCQVKSLPTETLVHPYIHDYFSKEFSVNRNYVQCVRKQRRRIQKCMQVVPWSHCGGRFGETSDERLNECRLLLTDDNFRSQRKHPKIFDDYRDCMTQLRQTVDQKCAAMLTATCRSRQLRVIKLVRATMESMEPLLRTLPNVRVIHLMRDPRAVVLSRQLFDSSARGLYAEKDNKTMLTKEAILYCRTVVRDVSVRSRLEKEFPGKIYSLIYDDLVKDLKGYSEKVYSFIDAKIPLSWVRKIASVAMMKNATRRASRWQRVLSYETNRDIVAVCKEFFRVIPYHWPLT